MVSVSNFHAASGRWISGEGLATGGHQASPSGATSDRASMGGVSATGNPYIDGLLSGTAWIGTVSYSFPNTRSDYETTYVEADAAAFGQVSFSQMQAARYILEGMSPHAGGPIMKLTSVESFTNLMLIDAGFDAADIRIAESSYANPTAYAYYPAVNNGYYAGDVWFGTSYSYDNPLVGNYAYVTMMHELGHSLGLKHAQDAGGPGRTAVPADRDSLEFTVMTYRPYIGGPTTGYTNEAFGFPQTFMMYDIAALQHIYGADFGFNNGNTVYRWSPTTGEAFVNGVGQGAPGNGIGGSANRVFLTIWDGGGVDTYDFSNYSTNQLIDLRPGQWSLMSQTQRANLGNGQYAGGNVYNALQFQGDPRSLIENAIGGSGSDVLTGNQVANSLTGGAGNDTLTGSEGNDTLDGGAGSDTAILTGLRSYYGVTLLSNGSLQIADLRSGAPDGTDVAQNIEWFRFSDKLYSLSEITASNPPSTVTKDLVVSGTNGADTLYGADGNDTLSGSGGSDTFWGGIGNDWIDGGDGIDTAIFSGSRSSTSTSQLSGQIFAKGPEGTDTLINVERLQFSDGAIAFDTSGNAGQIYRLYQAAFDRQPDQEGLGYWIDEFDAGKGDLAWVAKSFMLSNEFKSLYGSPETLSDDAFLNVLYRNVLDRDPDTEGKVYWMNELARGVPRENVLASFSESTENMAVVAPAIQDGIWYI